MNNSDVSEELMQNVRNVLDTLRVVLDISMTNGRRHQQGEGMSGGEEAMGG